MTNSQAVATRYFDAWKTGDFDALAGLLADDVSFEGPMGTVNGRDECIAGMTKMAESIDDIVIEKIFVDGSDVLTWYDLCRSDGARVPTVNWSHLSDGRISRIRALFDSGSH